MNSFYELMRTVGELQQAIMGSLENVPTTIDDDFNERLQLATFKHNNQ